MLKPKKRLILNTTIILTLMIGGCGTVPDSYDETRSWSAQKLYSEAKDELQSGSFEKAIKFFEALEARYPYGKYAQQAQLEIIYAYYKDNEFTSALVACDRFIKLYPNHPNVDYVYYMKGLINFHEDQGIFGNISNQDPSERDPKAARDSFDAFKELVKRYPNSSYAEESRERMNYLVNALASYEVHVAKFYMKRGAYVAAANRAQYAIKTYPHTPARNEAIAILADAYKKLNLKDNQQDTLRVIEKNNIPVDANLKNQNKPWWQLW